MAKKIKSTQPSKVFAVALACVLMFLLGLALGSGLNDSSEPLENKFVNTIPDGWQIKVEDNTNCHVVTVDAERITSEALEQYLVTKYNDSLENLIDSQNTYNISGEDVYVLKPQEDGGKNLIYLKSSNGTIYMIKIDDKPSDSKSTGTFCNKINTIVSSIITSLQ